MLKYLKNLWKFLCADNVVIISNTLQILNLKEFIFANKLIEKKFQNYFIICPYTDKKTFEIIKHCHKEFIKKNNLFLHFENFQHKNFLLNNGSNIKTLVLIFYLKKIFNFNIKHLIIGNYNSNLSKMFVKISKEISILDDGTNILDKDHLQHIKKTKFNYFSFFDKNMFPKNCYQQNEFNFFKKKFNNKSKKTSQVLIMGKPFIDYNFLKEYSYATILNIIKEKYANSEILYFPHPKEDLKHLKKFKSFKVLKSIFPLEIFIFKTKRMPKTIVSFNSSAVIPIKIFNKEIKIDNFFIDFKDRKKMTYEYKKYFPREYQIRNYFNKISIKTKTIYV